MKNILSIRREDLSKRGEKRVAVTPRLAQQLTEAGFSLLVQPARHPTEGEVKRAFKDGDYEKVGAKISEDLSEARLVFGLKEIAIDHIQENKAYLCFSHTHKGQVKNRKMLKAFMDRQTTLMDYELVTHDSGDRVITAFTYFAGYAGMIDTLWTVGKRLRLAGINHPFSKVPQSIEKEDLGLIKRLLKDIGQEIESHGTPSFLPPFINLILGKGKTSYGAQQIYDILPVEEIGLDQLEDVFRNGSRKKVYKCVLGITEMFRLKTDASVEGETYAGWSESEKENHYFSHPEDFESNLDASLPYATILMNCILWAPEFPRTMSKAWTKAYWSEHQNLQAIGDVTCDPAGSIEFSKETWIDNPVYVYNPNTGVSSDGFEGVGIAVMAVTNLPCEFSADASEDFSSNIEDLVLQLAGADFDAPSVENSGLPPEFARSVILWKGNLTPEYAYMAEFVEGI